MADRIQRIVTVEIWGGPGRTNPGTILTIRAEAEYNEPDWKHTFHVFVESPLTTAAGAPPQVSRWLNRDFGSHSKSSEDHQEQIAEWIKSQYDKRARDRLHLVFRPDTDPPRRPRTEHEREQ